MSNNLNIISHIIHLSDIHIPKNTDRHEEFKIVFDNLIKKIKSEVYSKNKVNLDKTVIVITGDILDNKLNVGIEQIDLLYYLMIQLTELTTVICIIGNHDCMMSNIDGEISDALTPLLSNLQTKNKIILLKKSGVFTYKNINFYLTTMFQKELTKSNKSNKVNIGLYHGGFKTTFIQNEYNTNNFSFTIEDFEKEYDIALLGDIHQRKIYKSKRLIQHAGSLLQLKADESINKGFILTDIINKKSKEINVENPYGIITVEVDSEGEYNLDEISLPHFIDLRIKGNIIKQNVIEKIRNKITKGKRKIVKERNMFNLNNNSSIKTIINLNEKALDFKTLNEKDLIELIYTRSISLEKITDDKKLSIKDKITNLVKNNFTLTSELKHFDLLEFEFSNYGKYGENNKIDFKKFDNKVIGINGPNGYGKSSIIYCIIYALYGINYFSLIEGSNKLNNHQLINKNKDDMMTKIKFKLNNNIYIIERNLSKNKKDSVGIKLDGKIIYEIKTATKKEAEKYILERLGEPKELIRTFFDLKGIYSNNFINLTPKERLIRLNDILNINCLNELNEAANNLKKAVSIDRIERTQVKERYNKYKLNGPHKLTYSNIYDFMKNRCFELDKEKVNLEKQIKMIDIDKENIVKFNIDDLLNHNKLLLEKKKDLKNKINLNSILYEKLLEKDINKNIKINLNKIRKLKLNLSKNVYTEELYKTTEKKQTILIKDIK